MTSAQKIIKYMAIAFAAFLIFTITTAIIGGLYGITSILDYKNNKDVIEDELTPLECNNLMNINSLEVDLNYSDLEIKVGDNFSVETNNKEIKCSQKNNKLILKEKSEWFINKKRGTLVIYLPDNILFENVEIDSNAGEVNIENLISRALELDLGAGKTVIDYIKSDKTEINTGAGSTEIKNGIINNLDFDMGVGSTKITALLKGINTIDAGVGELNINLIGLKEDYSLDVDKGIGNISIDNNKVSDGKIYGNGNNLINIDGGVGNINITFKNN